MMWFYFMIGTIFSFILFELVKRFYSNGDKKRILFQSSFISVCLLFIGCEGL